MIVRAVAPYLLSITCLGVAAAGGCADRQQTEPTIESSARETGYALAYPAALELHRRQLVDDKTSATTLTAHIKDYDPKTKADPALLLDIIERSDAAGRSRSFVDAQREARAFRVFWEENRGPISQRVASAAQKQASEAGCNNVELSGATQYALKDSFEKQLEKRVREHNDAQMLIEEQRSALGAAGFAEMQKLSDDIAYASFLVYVALSDDQEAIERMLDERHRIASTLDRKLDAEQRYLAGEAKTNEEKKASAARVAALEKSRGALDIAAKDADAEVNELDHTVRQARSDYDDAFDALQERIRQREKTAEARPR